MDDFLSSLIDHNNIMQLDLSYNSIEDECLYPIIKHLFANENAPNFANFENNKFTNYGKRTLAVAYSRCVKPQMRAKFGPYPLNKANLQIVTASENKFSVDVCIRRRPADGVAVKYLPADRNTMNELQKYKEKIILLR